MGSHINAITHTKLTFDFMESFVSLIARGATVVAACNMCQITYQTYWNYMRRGAEDEKNDADTMYREFYNRVKMAEGACELYAIEKWRAGFERDPKLAMQFLERRFPDRWSQRKYLNMEVDRELTKMLNELEKRLLPDTFNEVVNALREIGSEQEQAVSNQAVIDAVEDELS